MRRVNHAATFRRVKVLSIFRRRPVFRKGRNSGKEEMLEEKCILLWQGASSKHQGLEGGFNFREVIVR